MDQPVQRLMAPTFTADGDAVLFGASSGAAPSTQLAVISLDDGEQRNLLAGGSPRLLPTGHLMFSRGDALWAIRFDMTRLDVIGDPVPVLEGVDTAIDDLAQYAVADDGTLVYVEPEMNLATGSRLLALVDRTGVVERLDAPPNLYVAPRLSPDGRRLAVQADGQRSDILIYDLAGDSAIRKLTFEGNNVRPVWTPDGDSVTFASDRDGSFSIYRQRADGSAVAERLTTAEEGIAHWPHTWSPDGNTLAFAVEDSTGGSFNRPDNPRDLWTLSLESGESQVLAGMPPPTVEMAASFAPNGQWIAYTSGRSSSAGYETFVEPFPPTGEKHQISQGGGTAPLWSPTGNEVFYRPITFGIAAARQTLSSVAVSTDSPFRFTSPQPLSIGSFFSIQFHRNFDVTPDGQRFLVLLPTDGATDADSDLQVQVVLNWHQELLERVPVP